MHTAAQVRLDDLREALVKTAIQQGWQHKYAKFGRRGRGTQSLFVHSVNAFSIAQTLGPSLFDLSPSDTELASVAAFFHDYQKAENTWQEAAIRFIEGKSTTDADFAHDSGSPQMRDKLESLLREVDKSAGTDLAVQTDRILRIIVYTHDAVNSASAMKRKRQVGAIDPLSKVVRLSDSIASIKKAEDIKRKVNDPDIPAGKDVSFEYHTVSVIRGVISSFLNEAVTELMKEMGYTPLLYFGNSTAYIRLGEAVGPDDPRQRLRELLEAQFKKFQDSEIFERGLTEGVLGPITQTKWPSIHLVRERDIGPILNYLNSRPFTNKDQAFGRQYIEKSREKDRKKGHTENMDAINRLIKTSGTVSDDAIVAMMVSDFNLLVFVADYVKHYREFASRAGRGDEFDQKVTQWLKDTLGDFVPDDMNQIDNTTPASKRVATIEEVWHIGSENLHKTKDRREQITQRSIKLLTLITREFKDTAPPLVADEVVTGLLGDIEHIPVDLLSGDELRRLSTEVSERYLKGKSSTSRLCSLCSLTSVDDAPAGLFGDGSEKFSNLMEGGASIGSKRKAQVCPLCMLEGTLRKFYFGSPPYGTLLLLPDLSLSPDGFRLWSNALDDAVRSENLGLGIGKDWSMRLVYEHLSQGGIIDSSAELVRLLSPTKNDIKHLADFLRAERGNAEDVDYTVVRKAKNLNSLEGLARAHLEGSIVIDPYLLSSYSPKFRSERTSYFTASYALTFLNGPPGLKDEPVSSRALRLQLMALLLADVYHSKVVFIEGYQPFIPTEMRGMVRVEMPAPAANALESLGLKSTVQLHELDENLRRLSSLVRIAMTFGEKIGNDRLLRLSSMNRGAILRRVDMDMGKEMNDQQKHLLLSLLENMPAKAGEL